METVVYIMGIVLFICSLALLIAVRIIKVQDERLTDEIRNNDNLKRVIEELAEEKKNGRNE